MLVQEDGEELKRSLTGVGDNMDQLEAAGLMWDQVCVSNCQNRRRCTSLTLVCWHGS